MYRYSVDNAITYTPEDLDLFRESPFAVWMERLTLENPDHGIPPDTPQPAAAAAREDIIETLYAEGRRVTRIDGSLDEQARRKATLEAMRAGVDFIVDGQLALAPMSANANLLMRTSGYSALGDFLYIPCDTQARTTLASAFRLGFVADLLQELQDQLPPQMLVIHGGAEVQPLRTEDHIHFYWAVKKRFLESMRQFRKHRMPDPAESATFGRWYACANEILRQRALGEAVRQADSAAVENEQPAERVRRAAAGAGDYAAAIAELAATGESRGAMGGGAAATSETGVSQTLVEQALQLNTGSYRRGEPPGPTPNLARLAPLAPGWQRGQRRRSTDVALENLEFIGSNNWGAALPPLTREATPGKPPPDKLAPLPASPELPAEPYIAELVTDLDYPQPASNPPLPDLDPPPPVLLPPDEPVAAEPPPPALQGFDRRDSPDYDEGPTDSVVDLDRAPPPNLEPVEEDDEDAARLKRRRADLLELPTEAEDAPPAREAPQSAIGSKVPPFSSNLITNRDPEDI